MSESALIPHQTKALNTISARPIVPAIVAAAGDGAARRFLEFFTPKGGAHRRLAEVIMRTARTACVNGAWMWNSFGPKVSNLTFEGGTKPTLGEFGELPSIPDWPGGRVEERTSG
jgi:hypothetical protein